MADQVMARHLVAYVQVAWTPARDAKESPIAKAASRANFIDSVKCFR
jgi:hypothetical protein